MIAIPKKRERQRSGIERAPPREFPRHRAFIRRHVCSIEGKVDHTCEGSIEAAHVRTGTDGGISIKPSDSWLIPLCSAAHRLQHLIGEPAFERRFAIDMKELAKWFAHMSPDEKLRETLKEARQSVGRAKP